MPKGIRKEYTKEFKLTAIHLMKSKLMRPKDIFALLGGIDRQTVYRWVKEYDEEGDKAFEPKEAVLPGPSVRQLKKENMSLRMENEILKKATAYFAERNKKK